MRGKWAWHRQTNSPAHAEIPGEGVKAVKAQPCTFLGLTGTKLNVSEQNTTVVSKATSIETH